MKKLQTETVHKYPSIRQTKESKVCVQATVM